MSQTRLLLARAQELADRGVAFAWVSVLRVTPPSSARPGDKAIVTGDGRIDGWVGGGCAQPAVIRAVRAALADGAPRQIRVSPEVRGEQRIDDIVEFGMSCESGGGVELFVDPVLPDPTLVVLGASPVARTLAALAPHVGFEVRWVEQPGSASIPAGAFVVVASQGQGDLGWLRLALTSQAAHVALVASRRKSEVLREALREAGVPPARVDALEAPAGPAIQAHAPQEIALSVLAALVARRRGAKVEPEQGRATQPPNEGAFEAGRASEAVETLASVASAVAAVAADSVAPAARPPRAGGCCGGKRG